MARMFIARLKSGKCPKGSTSTKSKGRRRCRLSSRMGAKRR